jgi:HAMP domain-containing protein
VQPAPLPASVQAYAPDLARRLRLILTTLAAIIARRFLREPRLAALIVPLWRRLNRATRRFERLMARLAAGTLRKPHHSGRGGPHRGADALPTGRGWLVRALGPEAAACATQLQALLAEPAAAELLALAPTARRILRPLARMLAIGAFAPRPRPARAAPGIAPPGEPPPLGEVAFRSQGYTWYVVPTPPAFPA